LFESVLPLLEACCFGDRKLACVCDVLRCRYCPYAFDTLCVCKIGCNVRFLQCLLLCSLSYISMICLQPQTIKTCTLCIFQYCAFCWSL